MFFSKKKEKSASSNLDEVARLKEGLLTSLLGLAWMVEAKDPYTGGHLWRVSQLARTLGAALKYKEADIEKLAVAGFLHDLGKIGIPDHILGKTGRLTDEEFDVIKTHPQVGKDLLSGHPLSYLADEVIHAHHEMPNGNGYPKGLSSSDIPEAAKIVGLCDAFDAMTSTRPYRSGMPVEKALKIIEENLGKQFDQKLGEVFLRLGKDGAFNHIVSHSDDGIPLHECSDCGLTVTIRREQVIGEHTHCSVCRAEFLITEDEKGERKTEMTGKIADINQVTQQPDNSVIRDLVLKVTKSI